MKISFSYPNIKTKKAGFVDNFPLELQSGNMGEPSPYRSVNFNTTSAELLFYL